ncbi:putative integral membrane protein conserved region-domain-containing protein [Syncephalastrum racemosum]|uniref:Putative integral membrane protein conserved region-domain-containing protein n=1 Tax=Syncephalastrum racemosum TaxID=13706 RepID=A0A1X2HFM1_SYNRA|nr:putative integral membrane protein conserved region-domain-containing protein [Syncephalastrum racemosum]
MSTFVAAIAIAYVVGGLTLVPLCFLGLYLARVLTTTFYYDPLPITTTAEKESTPTDHANKHTMQTQQQQQQQQQQQLYKVGWVRVCRDEHLLVPPDTSIGEMVKTYISGQNSHEQQQQVYFAVLKGTTLFLYDSEKQLDCKDVIQVHHHQVSMHPPHLLDHELFTRPAAVKLHTATSNYYINCARCIDKEDWYLALLRASKRNTTQTFDQSALNAVIHTIHSDEHHFQTQWFNAILGRIFFGVHKTDQIEQFLYKKIVTKLAKLNARLPPFLGPITVRSVHPGHALPYITRPVLRGLSPQGDLHVDCHLQYAGAVRVEIETTFQWKYSDHLRPLSVDLVLAVTLKSLEGDLALKIKEPPTNRMWYGFHAQPKVEWRVEPLVSERRISYSRVVKAIESKIEELLAENAVLPNMDDITFFPTEGLGAIFDKESISESASLPELSILKNKSEVDRKVTLSSDHLDKIYSTSPPDTLSTDSSSDENTSFTSSTPMTSDFIPPSLCETYTSSPSSFKTNTMLHPSSSNSTRTSQRVRLRKSVSFTKLRSKTVPSTAVSQVNVSPAMYKESEEKLVTSHT